MGKVVEKLSFWLPEKNHKLEQIFIYNQEVKKSMS